MSERQSKYKKDVRKPIIVVQGGQWGSEGKGMVAAALCIERGVDLAVRTGTVNAGHTVYYRGKAYKMQQLPTGWVNPNTKLVLGPGAYIHPDILGKEIAMVSDATGKDVMERLYIDRNCGLHLPAHTERSTKSGRHYLMGATGKGCSEAIVDKISGRGTDRGVLFSDWSAKTSDDWAFWNTPDILNHGYDTGAQILLEGTQGSHLDLHLGPYPYTTHKQSQAAQWAMEAGLGLGAMYEIFLVCRSFPIRVAGNSGPMPKETTWPFLNILIKRVASWAIRDFEHLVEELGAKCYGLTLQQSMHPEQFSAQWREANAVALSELNARVMRDLPQKTRDELAKLFEFTTVTGKLRRVAQWDTESVLQAIRWNRPHHIVLSFWNYWYPERWGKTYRGYYLNDEEAGQIAHLTRELGVPVSYITTGPEHHHFLKVESLLLGRKRRIVARAKSRSKVRR